MIIITIPPFFDWEGKDTFTSPVCLIEPDILVSFLSMIIKTYPDLTNDQKSSVLKIWNKEYPKQMNKSIDELDVYLSGLENVVHFLILNNDEKVLGWAFKFSRDLQRWFVIILCNTIHEKGWGSKILQKIIENEVDERLGGRQRPVHEIRLNHLPITTYVLS